MRGGTYRWFVRGAALALAAAVVYGMLVAAMPAVRELRLIFVLTALQLRRVVVKA